MEEKCKLWGHVKSRVAPDKLWRCVGPCYQPDFTFNLYVGLRVAAVEEVDSTLWKLFSEVGG